jgi:hypothetical protein
VPPVCRGPVMPARQSACQRARRFARVSHIKCSTAGDRAVEPDTARCTFAAIISIPTVNSFARLVRFHRYRSSTSWTSLR